MTSPEEQAESFLQNFDFDDVEAPAAPCLSDASDEAEHRWYDSARALDDEGGERQGALDLGLEEPSPEDLDFGSATSEPVLHLPAARPKSAATASASFATVAHDHAIRQQAVADLFKRRRLDLPNFFLGRAAVGGGEPSEVSTGRGGECGDG